MVANPRLLFTVLMYFCYYVLNSFAEEKEELCIGKAIYLAISSSIDHTELSRCTRLLETSFPQIKSYVKEKVIQDVDNLLLFSVKQQVLSDSLYAKEDFILKVSFSYEIVPYLYSTDNCSKI